MTSRIVYHQGFRAVPMSAPVPATYPPPGSTVFYVSGIGSDTNPGTFAAPWRTHARAMQQNYIAGQYLLFERGHEYVASYVDKAPAASGSLKFTIGAYGTGAKPILHSYRILNNASAWVNMGNNVWRLDTSAGTATHSGYTAPHPNGGANIGHLLVGNVVYGWKRLSQGAMVNQWDYFTEFAANPGIPYLYVKSFGNPTTLAPDLRAAADVGGGGGATMIVGSNTVVRDLHITGTGGHGISGSSGGCNNSEIFDCVISRTGGSCLIGYTGPSGPNTVRYGNCFNFIFNMSNMSIHDNEAYEAFDASYTNQLGGVANGIDIRNNFFHHSAQHFEFWSNGGSINNVLIEDNDLEDCGYGFGAVTRPEQWNRCCFLSYRWGTSPVNVTTRNNRIKRAFSTYRFHDPSWPFPTSWIFQNNDIDLVSGTPMCASHDSHTINNAAAWATFRSTESGSTFQVL